MKTAKFHLETLTCPTCIDKIEGALNKEPGVLNVKVRFNFSKVDVEYDEHTISTDHLTDAIERTGYPVLSYSIIKTIQI